MFKQRTINLFGTKSFFFFYHSAAVFVIYIENKIIVCKCGSAVAYCLSRVVKHAVVSNN